MISGISKNFYFYQYRCYNLNLSGFSYNVHFPGKCYHSGYSPPNHQFAVVLRPSIKIAKLEKEKIALLDKIAQLNRQLLYAGIGINLIDFEES